MFGETNEDFTIATSTYYIADNLQPREVDLPSTKQWFHRYFDPLREGSLRGNIANNLSLTINAGCFMYPFILTKFGICQGMILIIIIAAVNFVMSKFLLFSTMKTKIRSNQLLIEKQCGTLWKQVYNIINLVSILLMIASVLHIQDQMIHKLLGERNHDLYYFLLKCASCFLIQIPLVFIRKAPYLYITSIFGLLLFCYVMGVIIYHMVININKETISISNIVNWYDYFIAFGLINSSFVMQNKSCNFANDILDPTKRRTNKVLNISFIIEVIIALLLGIGGYFFNRYEDTSLIIFINNDIATPYYDMKITYSAMISLIISIVLFTPVRWSVFRRNFKGLTENTCLESKSTIRLLMIILFIVLLNIISHLEYIIPLTCFYGGILAVANIFIFPTVIYSSIFGKDCYAILGFFTTAIFMIIGLTASILSFSKVLPMFIIL